MERAILVGVNLDNGEDFERYMDELSALAEACEMEVVAKVVQNLPFVNKALYIGSGKVAEVASLCDMLEADIVIFDTPLTPSQLRNLQKEIKKPIMDRTTLILEIFAKRAQTREAKLQVEVARLQYTLPRLVGLHDALSRQGGGSGLSNKGSGEKKLELDRRRIEQRLVELKKELEHVARERQTQSKLRNSSNVLKVALVGYTNAGKSTIMNEMVKTYMEWDEKTVLEKDMLFATLETTVRNIEVDQNQNFLLSDTVGFVSKLPHHLVKAFRSTLEEVKNADLLLRVVDFNDPYYKEQLQVTRETLEDLDAMDIPVITVYNKADLCGYDSFKQVDNNFYMSAKRKEDIEALVQGILSFGRKDYVTCNMLIPFEAGNVTSYLMKEAHVLNTEYREDGTFIEVECSTKDYNKYVAYVVEK